MTETFKKLNYKYQECIYILNAPDAFSTEVMEMNSVCSVFTALTDGQIDFILVFVYSCDDIRRFAEVLGNRHGNDPVIWFAYPKKSSKKYKTDISRDSGWQPLGNLGLEPVRQIAIDEDWSALRFRNPDFIKTMKRNPEMMLSEKGRKRK
jgi:hypothetical protein